MDFDRIIRMLQAGILSVAGVALLTQMTSAEEMENMGNAEDLQGNIACDVVHNPWLKVAPLGELPCELPIGGLERIPLGMEQEIMQLDDTTKEDILYNRNRQDHPDALVVGDR